MDYNFSSILLPLTDSFALNLEVPACLQSSGVAVEIGAKRDAKLPGKKKMAIVSW